MKPIYALILILFSGCVSQQDIIHEDRLYVTRKYIGDYVQMYEERKDTHIITSEESFYISGKPGLNIPTGARCYVKYIPESMAGSTSKYWVLYFTWDGTEDLFMVRQNWITGQVY